MGTADDLVMQTGNRLLYHLIQFGSHASRPIFVSSEIIFSQFFRFSQIFQKLPNLVLHWL